MDDTKTLLLQALGLSQKNSYENEWNGQAEERAIDFGGLVLEALYAAGYISMSGAQSPITPGQSEAMARITWGNNRSKQYMKPLSAVMLAAYDFITVKNNERCAVLCLQAHSAYRAFLKTISYPDGGDEFVSELLSDFPETEKAFRYLMSPEGIAFMMKTAIS